MISHIFCRRPKTYGTPCTDASRLGLGFVPLQQDPVSGHRHIIQCGSRSLTGPESRYAVCELEGLAILYAINKCRHYLLGMDTFTVITDHKPLKGVFQKDLPDVENVRLRRYREKLTEYNFQIEWREGKLNEIADALSQAPVFPHLKQIQLILLMFVMLWLPGISNPLTPSWIH